MKLDEDSSSNISNSKFMDENKYNWKEKTLYIKSC